jgi:hypothetical protein
MEGGYHTQPKYNQPYILTTPLLGGDSYLKELITLLISFIAILTNISTGLY